jgi:hypothetical protein
MQKLANIVLKQEGWEIYDLTEDEFESWDFEDRVANIKGWLKGAKEKQFDKGVMDRNPPRYI